MKIKVLVVIILVACLFFGFKKISYQTNKFENSNIEELKILKFIPENNKFIFISNFKSSKIIQNIKKNLTQKNKEKLIIFEKSILDYLGIDIGRNKLEDIYDNELIIATYENKKKTKDDILMVFKIKSEKNIDDILNLPTDIDQNDKIIPIYRENKLNYLKYVYRTKGNIIITSSDKELIYKAINPKKKTSNDSINYLEEFKLDLKNKNNILFSSNVENSFLFNKIRLPFNNEDKIITTFSLNEKNLLLKSYLVNNKKNLNILSYKDLTNKSIINEGKYQVSIYCDLTDSIEYIKPLLKNFDQSFLEELSQKLNKNVLLLNSDKNWSIAYEDNNQKILNINDIKKLKSFNKYSLEKNNNIYSIYSKDVLEDNEGGLKKYTFEDIYTVDSDGFFILSNYLIEDKDLDLISAKFYELDSNEENHDFLNNEVYIKGLNSKNNPPISYLEDLNFLLKNVVNLENQETTEIIKQSIPEKNPIFYREKSYQIFQ